MFALPPHTVRGRRPLVSLVALVALVAFAAWPRVGFAASPCRAQAALHGCCCGDGARAATGGAPCCARTCAPSTRVARSNVDDHVQSPPDLGQLLQDPSSRPPGGAAPARLVPVPRPVGRLFLFNRVLLL
jgi:hypothetical protein